MQVKNTQTTVDHCYYVNGNNNIHDVILMMSVSGSAAEIMLKSRLKHHNTTQTRTSKKLISQSYTAFTLTQPSRANTVQLWYCAELA